MVKITPPQVPTTHDIAKEMNTTINSENETEFHFIINVI